MKEKVKIIADEGCWIESNAVEQLYKMAELPGCTRAVGLPDLHAGKVPVGMSLETEGIVYPHLIGNDIGCGMTLFHTGISRRQYKPDRWVKKLEQLNLLPVDLQEGTLQDLAMGTLGGGNHFAEFQVLDGEVGIEMGASIGAGTGASIGAGTQGRTCIGKKDVLLLVHCGSRGYGQDVYQRFAMAQGLREGTEEFGAYMREHDEAVAFARKNRQAVAQRLMDALGFDGEPEALIDCCHNLVEQRGDRYLHRKGAVAADGEFVVIPGSRGSLTYVAKPTEKVAKTLWSLSHGAGRKYQRSACRDRFRSKYKAAELKTTDMKSHVICKDKRLLYEEAPDAYKNIEHIIGCMEEQGLITVAATLRPLLTFKG